MNVKCPNCDNVTWAHKSLTRLAKCVPCNLVCCWLCEETHIEEVHRKFVNLKELELEKYTVKELF